MIKIIQATLISETAELKEFRVEFNSDGQCGVLLVPVSTVVASDSQVLVQVLMMQCQSWVENQRASVEYVFSEELRIESMPYLELRRSNKTYPLSAITPPIDGAYCHICKEYWQMASGNVQAFIDIHSDCGIMIERVN